MVGNGKKSPLRASAPACGVLSGQVRCALHFFRFWVWIMPLIPPSQIQYGCHHAYWVSVLLVLEYYWPRSWQASQCLFWQVAKRLTANCTWLSSGGSNISPRLGSRGYDRNSHQNTTWWLIQTHRMEHPVLPALEPTSPRLLDWFLHKQQGHGPPWWLCSQQLRGQGPASELCSQASATGISPLPAAHLSASPCCERKNHLCFSLTFSIREISKDHTRSSPPSSSKEPLQVLHPSNLEPRPMLVSITRK